MIKTRLLLLFAYLLFSGCSTTFFRNSVSSAADTSIAGCCTFFIIPSDESIDTSSLIWRNFEKQVTNALELQGYAKAVNPAEADLGIVAAAGIGDPRTENWSVPVFGQTGTVYTGSTTTGNVNVFGNTATVNSNTTYSSQPQYGVVGARQISGTVYDRWLVIRAFSMTDKAPNGGFLEAWQTFVQSSGSSGDIAVVAPYMLAVAQDYFGKTLNKPKAVTIMAGSQKVDLLIQ